MCYRPAGKTPHRRSKARRLKTEQEDATCKEEFDDGKRSLFRNRPLADDKATVKREESQRKAVEADSKGTGKLLGSSGSVIKTEACSTDYKEESYSKVLGFAAESKERRPDFLLDFSAENKEGQSEFVGFAEEVERGLEQELQQSAVHTEVVIEDFVSCEDVPPAETGGYCGRGLFEGVEDEEWSELAEEDEPNPTQDKNQPHAAGEVAKYAAKLDTKAELSRSHEPTALGEPEEERGLGDATEDESNLGDAVEGEHHRGDSFEGECHLGDAAEECVTDDEARAEDFSNFGKEVIEEAEAKTAEEAQAVQEEGNSLESQNKVRTGDREGCRQREPAQVV